MKLDRISLNPTKMNGQPCIRDLRRPVQPVIELLATYPDRNELREEFPELEGYSLEDEDIQQSLMYAHSMF